MPAPPLTVPGHHGPGASFDQPFDMLDACHDRVVRSLSLLQRLVDHLRSHAVDEQARDAARDVLRYFDMAAPAHHEDEERHVFPLLRARGPAALAPVLDTLMHDHQVMARRWSALRPALAALQRDGQPLTGQAVEQALAFAAAYDTHLRLENEQVFPAARALADAALQAQMGQEMAQRRGAAVAPSDAAPPATSPAPPGSR